MHAQSVCSEANGRNGAPSIDGAHSMAGACACVGALLWFGVPSSGSAVLAHLCCVRAMLAHVHVLQGVSLLLVTRPVCETPFITKHRHAIVRPSRPLQPPTSPRCVCRQGATRETFTTLIDAHAPHRPTPPQPLTLPRCACTSRRPAAWCPPSASGCAAEGGAAAAAAACACPLRVRPLPAGTAATRPAGPPRQRCVRAWAWAGVSRLSLVPAYPPSTCTKGSSAPKRCVHFSLCVGVGTGRNGAPPCV